MVFQGPGDIFTSITMPTPGPKEFCILNLEDYVIGERETEYNRQIHLDSRYSG
jgi:hypothetical protein